MAWDYEHVKKLVPFLVASLFATSALCQTINNLPSGSSPSGTEFVPAWQSGTVKLTAKQVASTSGLEINGGLYVASDPTCTTDATAGLRAAITAATGKRLKLPPGTFCLNTAASTLVVASSIDISGAGQNTIIKWNAPANSAIAPIFDITGSNVTVHDLAINHNANAVTYTDSTYYSTNVWGDVAFVVEGDYFTGYNLWGYNGYDNCFGIGKMSAGSPVAGSPQWFNLNNIQTNNCGTGVHSVSRGGPGKIGAGIDNGSGSAGSINNVVDYQSYIGFISDIGAGAYANWSNVTAFYTQVDSLNPTNGSGYGVYNGSVNSTWSNVNIINPGKLGLWNDYAAGGLPTSYSNVNVKAASQNCLWIKGPATFNGVRCQDSSQAGSNLYDDILIDSTAGSITGLLINGLYTTGTLHARSINTTGANPIQGHITGGPYSGVSAAYSLGANTGLSVEATSANGVGFNNPNATYAWDFTGTTRIAGHILSGGSTPVVTSCGTSPSNFGSDVAGKIHEGTTATGCTLTFASAFANVPYCSVTPLAPLTSFTYTVSASAITITHGSASNTDIDYICNGPSNG